MSIEDVFTMLKAMNDSIQTLDKKCSYIIENLEQRGMVVRTRFDPSRIDEAARNDWSTRKDRMVQANPEKKFTKPMSIEEYNSMPAVQEQNKGRELTKVNANNEIKEDRKRAQAAVDEANKLRKKTKTGSEILIRDVDEKPPMAATASNVVYKKKKKINNGNIIPLLDEKPKYIIPPLLLENAMEVQPIGGGSLLEFHESKTPPTVQSPVVPVDVITVSPVAVIIPPPADTIANLDKMSVGKLKEICQTRGYKKYSTHLKSKQSLVEFIMKQNELLFKLN